MAAIIKGHFTADGPQAEAVRKTLAAHGVQITKTDERVYDFYLDAANVDAETGMRNVVAMLDREHPGWRDVLTVSA